MVDIEIPDPTQAKNLLLQGVCLSRVVRLTPARLKPTLTWALALVGEGLPLPPIGFVTDLGHIALGFDRDVRQSKVQPMLASWDTLLRTYEDHVLGKIFADRSFDRASDVLRKLSGKEQARGIAFVIDQFRTRAGFAGMHISPAVIKALIEMPPEEVIARAWFTLESSSLDPILEEMYQSLITGVRMSSDLLGSEDVFELEHGTALADFGQRVALRQVLKAAEMISAGVPSRPPAMALQRKQVPTRMMDEDAYPVGGFASISNRGSIESLLHSQLAMMENDPNDRPDMFDIKFLRDELLYYSRDENQFFRQHRQFAIHFDESLTSARFKDPAAPFQRIILALGATIVMIRRAGEWLDRDELVFELTIAPALTDEMMLLKTILRDEISIGTVTLNLKPKPKQESKHVQGHPPFLLLSCVSRETEDASWIDIGTEKPTLRWPQSKLDAVQNNDYVERWIVIVSNVLTEWTSGGIKN